MPNPALIDCHTHTSFSFDSDARLEEMYRQAVRIGLAVYAVTDHSDHCCDTLEEQLIECGFDPRPDAFWEDTEAAFRGMLLLREEEPDAPVKLLSGIELGEPLQNRAMAEEILRRPYDMVIGSLHNVSEETDFYFLDYQAFLRAELDALLNRYFDELEAMVAWGKFDTLAHITYPFRYLAERGTGITPADYDDRIEALLKRLAESGRALECNTSGLRQAMGETMPGERYLKRFRELGGEYVTIGSDAHTPADLGAGIAEGYELLRRAGFSYVTYYEQRRPVQVAL